jgi:ABC-type multidrug transport system fused ATPase/permease subunit
LKDFIYIFAASSKRKTYIISIFLCLFSSIGINVGYILALNAIKSNDKLQLMIAITILIVLVFIFPLSDYLSIVFKSIFEKEIVMSSRLSIFDKISSKSLEEFTKVSKDVYLSNFTSDINVIENDILSNFYNCIFYFMITVVGGLVILFIDRIIFILVCIISILLILFSFLFSNRMRNKQIVISNLNEQNILRLSNLLHGHRDIMYFNANKMFIKKNECDIEGIVNEKSKLNLYQSCQGHIARSFINMILAMSILYITWNIINGKSFILYIFLFAQLNIVLMNLVNIVPCFLRFNSAISIYNKINKSFNDIHIEKKKTFSFYHEIKIEKLSFGYGDTQIINNVSIKIKKNRKYMLVGKSGCGKTTLIKILTGDIKAQLGSVFYDTTDINDIELNSLYKEVSIISQDIYLFNDSLFNNITLYKDVDDIDVMDVIHKCGLYESFIDLFENDGYKNKSLGENGSKISGGQKQRIAIARALLGNAQIFIIDEGTSSLDLEAVSILEECILNRNTTIISICHHMNLDIMRKYDFILEMNDSKIECYEVDSYLKTMYKINIT